MLYVVKRKFSDGKRAYEPNEVVDLEGRNLDKLVTQRYIEIAPKATSKAKSNVQPTKETV